MIPWQWRGDEGFQTLQGPHRDPELAKFNIESCYGHAQRLLCRTNQAFKVYLFEGKIRFGGRRKMFYTEEEAKAWVTVMVRM